jgi:hypothetical protein
MTPEPYNQPSDDERLLEYLTGNEGQHLFDQDYEIGKALGMPPDLFFAARGRLLTAGLLRVGGRATGRS